MLAGMHAAQTCRSDELIPNVLLPIISKPGTINPINGPATYQGQGCLIKSIILILFLVRPDPYILSGFFNAIFTICRPGYLFKFIR